MVKVFDGTQLTVQFYANHGSLRQVAEQTGVSINALKRFADTGEISQEQRKKIEDAQKRAASSLTHAGRAEAGEEGER
jgi:predicted xylose isomerase-like sugar epimerase